MAIKMNSSHGVRIGCDSPACMEVRRKRRQRQPRFLLQYTWLADGLSLCFKCPECGVEHMVLIEALPGKSPAEPRIVVFNDGPIGGASGAEDPENDRS
jgi:hypothetical protein